MSPAALVGSLRRRGVLLAPAGDGRLRYHPREALSEADREFLAGNRDAILALFEADPIGWRAAIMAARARRTDTLPLLLARPGVTFRPGSCCSCGEPLEQDDRYRCHPCVAATVRVLAAVRVAGSRA
jgi:hypothetical protein